MKIFVPDYYRDFKCIADKCTDSCCVGWAIEIDDVTLEKYKKLKGNIGTELMSTIDTEGGASFKCQADGRCANLDDRGLCKIISKIGEDYLCQICSDHPRYFNCAFGRCEGGLGLACEVATDLILSVDRLPKIMEVESADVVYLSDRRSPFSFSARDYIFSCLFDSERDICSRLGHLLKLAFAADEVLFDIICGEVDENTPAEELLASLPELPFDFSDFISVHLPLFADLEMLTEEYSDKMSAAILYATKNTDSFIEFVTENEAYTRNLTYYFIHRYLIGENLTVSDNMTLAIACTVAVMALAFLNGVGSHQGFIEAAKDFSKNIEYSTENIETLLDRIENV